LSVVWPSPFRAVENFSGAGEIKAAFLKGLQTFGFVKFYFHNNDIPKVSASGKAGRGRFITISFGVDFCYLM